jgi:hypothetical protein
VCDLETTKILVNEEEAKAHWGAVVPKKKKISDTILTLSSATEIDQNLLREVKQCPGLDLTIGPQKHEVVRVSPTG